MAGTTIPGYGSGGTFMFHPRPTVFEHPITYNLNTLKTNNTVVKETDKKDLAQYYISEHC